jgi:hypothetical protein
VQLKDVAPCSFLKALPLFWLSYPPGSFSPLCSVKDGAPCSFLKASPLFWLSCPRNERRSSSTPFSSLTA